MTAIDDRAAEAAIKDKLGASLGDEGSLTACTIKPYYNAALINIPGAGVYVLSEATVAGLFRSPLDH